jgi:hypothetical protein
MGASGHDHTLSCNLQLEDEFVLTQIRAKAKALTNQKDRDQFFWSTVYRFVCRERAYKTVMSDMGICIDTNVKIIEDDAAESK